MVPKSSRRSVTLSISLTPELMSTVNSKINSGLYTYASELIREALRLLLHDQHDQESGSPKELAKHEPVSERLTGILDASRLGAGLHDQKLRRQMPHLTESEIVSTRLATWNSTESDDVIRDSPARLKRLRKQLSTS